MGTLTPTDLAFQNAGRYLTWYSQETGSTSVNGAPVAGSSGLSVVDRQKAKIVVTPNSGATLTFRVWIEYEGRQGFALVDGLENIVTSEAWTQELNVSGASRLYVEITAIDTGDFDVDIATAQALENPETEQNIFVAADGYLFTNPSGNQGEATLANDSDYVRRWSSNLARETHGRRYDFSGDSNPIVASVSGRKSVLFGEDELLECHNLELGSSQKALTLFGVFTPLDEETDNQSLFRLGTSGDTYSPEDARFQVTLRPYEGGIFCSGQRVSDEDLNAEGYYLEADDLICFIATLDFENGKSYLWLAGDAETPVAENSYGFSGLSSSNDSQTISLGTPVKPDHTLDSTRSYYGHTHEIRIYNEALNQAKRQTLFDSASTRWGVTALSDVSAQAPDSLSGLVGWWDASDAGSVTEDGFGVTDWSDKSGNSNHATQSTDSSKPSYGTDAIVFDGNDDYLSVSDDASLDLTTDCTIIVVSKKGVDNTQSLINKGSVNEGYELGWGSSGDGIFRINWQGVNERDLRSSAQPTGQTQILCAIHRNDFRSFYIDRILDAQEAYGTTINTNNDDLVFGARNTIESYFEGEINEVIIYDRALTNAEKKALNLYLVDKWSL